MSVGEMGRGRLVLLAALLSSFIALAASSQAMAVVRYAKPNGSPTNTCTRFSACDFATAVQGAQDGDEVVVERGSYDLGATPVTDTAAITIHGAVGQPRPVLHSDVAGEAAFSMQNAGSQVRFLELDAPQGTAFSMSGGLAEELVAIGGGSSDGACTIDGGLLRDSTCVAHGTAGAGVLSDNTGSGSAAVRNVTAIGAGASADGVFANAADPGASVALSLVNVIARGSGQDVAAQAASGDSAAVTITHSNYASTAATPPATISDDGTQQTAEPVFVDAAADNYHEAPSSPTVGQGLTDPSNGPYDVDGNARVVQGRTDIGSDERDLPPAVSTLSAVPVHPDGATLRGMVNPDGPPTSVWFQYGRSRRYGSSVPAGELGPGGVQILVVQALLGLRPGTVYHYRLVASNPQGTRRGRDQMLATPALLLTGLRQAASTWPVATGGGANGGTGGGTSFSFTLNDTARVTFTFMHEVAGRRPAGGKCRAHAGRGPACSATRTVGVLRVKGQPGPNTFDFSGRLNGRALAPGRYTVKVQAASDGAATRARRLSFTVLA